MMEDKMSDAPCKDCAKRALGCHDKCPKYGKWKADREDFLESKRKHRMISDALATSTQRRCKSRSESNQLNKYRETKRRNCG
jgi:hypothetical protein